MKFVILTIFPEFFESPLKASLLGKAIDSGLVEVERIDIRDFTEDIHHTVDDLPFGGGAGMVMMPGPVVQAIESVKAGCEVQRVLYLSPRGRPLTQAAAAELSRLDNLVLICGRYEGLDQRVIDGGWIDEEISIGDYVLAGGEVAALTLIECVTRLLPDVLGNTASLDEESHANGRLEYPHYTRPRVFRDLEVPDVLLSGHHKKISDWRKKRSVELTLERRPDLVDRYPLRDDEKKLLDIST